MVPTYASTKYQIACYNKDGRQHVLGYSAKHTRQSVLNNIKLKGNRGKCFDFAGAPDDAEWTWDRRLKSYVWGGWRIGFTGRTERDVKNAPQS